MNRTSQTSIIRECILSYLHKGLTDNQDIYSKVIGDLGVPRPTVRRISRELRNELVEYVKTLQNTIPKPTQQEKLKGRAKFSLERSCPRCTSKNGFECVHLQLDEEFGYEITCNNCGARFHEIYQFAFWEEQ